MIVFFRRIPQESIRQDLLDVLEPVLKGKIFQKTGVIKDIKFITHKDTQTNAIEVHAMVLIDSDAAAKRVIKKLNRKAFKGKHIAVREYHYRSWHNDPRGNIREWHEQVADKRKDDRRGRNRKLYSGGISVKKIPTKPFNRKI